MPDPSQAPAIPATMPAVRLHAPGGIDALTLDEMPVPRPGPGEMLIRVRAAAITRDELTWSTDRLPYIPSFELSGVVAAAGAGVSAFRPGDAVFALTPFDRQGVAAGYAVVPATFLAPKPVNLSHAEAAALPMAALTSWQALFEHGGLRAGQRVIIIGAAGGVGHVAVQLAHHHGAHVTAVASPGRHDLLRQLGADDIVDRKTALRGAITAGDLVFDTSGRELLAASPHFVRPGGRIVTVSETPPAGVDATYFVVVPNGEQLVELTPMFAAGDVRAVIAGIFSIDQAPAAFAALSERGKSGKIVLEVRDASA
jgi:NADPH:quinone reductase-like Zn-dependent oxidoreductase